MEFEKYDQSTFGIIRKVLNYSQEQIADICGITRQTVNNIESGAVGRFPTITLIGLCLDGIAKEQGQTDLVEILKSSGNKSE